MRGEVREMEERLLEADGTEDRPLGADDTEEVDDTEEAIVGFRTGSGLRDGNKHSRRRDNRRKS
jgi:hypothetical protein